MCRPTYVKSLGPGTGESERPVTHPELKSMPTWPTTQHRNNLETPVAKPGRKLELSMECGVQTGPAHSSSGLASSPFTQLQHPQPKSLL